MEEIVISCKNIGKVYRLYTKPADKVKDVLGLTKKVCYTEHNALADVSFDIRRGECVGIIGANGAGKSTILKVITGVVTPSSGETVINGRISALLELGAGFNQEYTGLENIYINGRMSGLSREEIDEKLQSIIDFADIGDFIHQPVKTYSSGMFVRLAFAVAINIDPDILIVDEALSVGDVFFQAKCFNKFEEFKRAGRTILFVSHALGTIQKYCDRAILLNHGKKIKEGKPKEIIDLYNRILSEEKFRNNEKKIKKSREAVLEKSEWKNRLVTNPKPLVYGDKAAEIIDFGIFDDGGTVTNTILKGNRFTVKIKVRFNSSISNPICAFTLKDIKGVEVAGSNTFLANKPIGKVEEGDVITVSFSQVMRLRSNEYLLCLGCTEIQQGEVKVYHRLFDVANISVLSDGDTVGIVDLDSVVEVE